MLAIFAGLTVWVGIWDLIDYHVLPFLSRTCDAAGAEPGPAELLRSPGCCALKLSLVAVGAIGLWATRSLYGRESGRSAQFQRFA